MHRVRIDYTHGRNAKWVIYACKIAYSRCCVMSTCDAKWVIYVCKFMYLCFHLLSTRDAKCVIYARKIKVNSCTFVHIFHIPVNFLPFALVDPGPADSSAVFGAGAGAAPQPGASGAPEATDLVTLRKSVISIRYVHGYGKVANMEAGMLFLEDRVGILHWKILRGMSRQPLGAKTVGGSGREAAGPSVTLFCPFWVKHKKGQEEKVFLVPFLYMRPPSSDTWALLSTEDELGQLLKVRGVPLSEIAGVLPGTREVAGVAQTAALTARVEAFWLRWEKEARSDMSRKVEVEAQKLAQGEDVASQSSAGKKSYVVPGQRSRGRPPQGARTGAGCHSGRANVRATAAAVRK